MAFAFTLEKWSKALAPSLAESANDERIPRFLRNTFPHPYTEECAVFFISAVEKMRDKGLFYAIVSEGRAIGGIDLTLQEDVHCRQAELGYWLNPNFWGKGIMTEAVGRICAEAFEKLPVNRIQAQVFGENAASCRVLEKCGFQREGVLRQSIFKNGIFYDERIYGLLASERGEL